MRRLDRSEREGFDSLAWVEEGLGAEVRGAGFGDERKKRIGPACTEVLSGAEEARRRERAEGNAGGARVKREVRRCRSMVKAGEMPLIDCCKTDF